MAAASIAAYGAGALSCFAFGTAFAAQMLSRKLRNEAESDEEDDGPSRQRRAKADASTAEFMGTAGREGFTMEESRRWADKEQQKASARSPKEVLAGLQRGNVRFWTGTAKGADKSAFDRRALIAKQWPTTAVLGCSDSRVPTEIVFDQGLGDMFVVRVAGNCLSTGTTASLLYAIFHLKVKVVMVMGHEGCGAVKAALQPVEAIDGEPEALGALLKSMKTGLDYQRYSEVMDPRSHDREAIVTNLRRQCEKLVSDDQVMALVKRGELIIVGTFYEISSGIVDFLFEVSTTSDIPPETYRPNIR